LASIWPVVRGLADFVLSLADLAGIRKQFGRFAGLFAGSKAAQGARAHLYAGKVFDCLFDVSVGEVK
jgi:hypothetical protein